MVLIVLIIAVLCIFLLSRRFLNKKVNKPYTIHQRATKYTDINCKQDGEDNIGNFSIIFLSEHKKFYVQKERKKCAYKTMTMIGGKKQQQKRV